MRYLFSDWPKISKKLRNHHLCIFLDYDGTLAPITKLPNLAKLPEKTKEVLQSLVATHACHVAMVSGRQINNLYSLVGIKDIIYAGNHGLEVSALGSKIKIPVSLAYKKLIKSIYLEFKKKFKFINGVIIENKSSSITLHYRAVAKTHILAVKSIFNNLTRSLVLQKKITIIKGKKVLEIFPPVIWHKGKLVLLILALLKSLFNFSKIMSIYIGDDLTDENAFKSLARKGITVIVGKTKGTAANYYLKNPEEVRDFLQKIVWQLKIAN